jgi:hypothetical protein
MGQEVVCKARIDGKTHQVKALLETDEIVIRGDAHVVIPLRSVNSAKASGGVLHVRWLGHDAAIDLGEKNAAKWAEKITNPKSRLDKIGVKPGQRISVVSVDDPDLIDELKARGADVSTKIQKASDAIFFGVRHNRDLEKLNTVKESLAPAGALWVIRPKGQQEITEAATMNAGKAAGLVDVKVVKFSETHTAEKFVIPVAKR